MLTRDLRLRIVVQQIIEPLRGGRDGFVQASQVLILNLGIRRAFLNFDADFAAQFVQHLFEFEAVAFHHEREDIAAGVARAEALPRIRLRPDDERRRARVSVERAHADVGAAALAQLHRFGHDVHNIQPVFDVVDNSHREMNNLQPWHCPPGQV